MTDVAIPISDGTLAMNDPNLFLTILVWLLYSVFNLLYYAAPPLLLYFLSWQKLRMKKIYSAFVAIFAGYIFGNISTHLKWSYKFQYYRVEMDVTRSHAYYNTADGANLVFWLVAGWMPVTIYVLFCWWVLSILRKRDVL